MSLKDLFDNITNNFNNNIKLVDCYKLLEKYTNNDYKQYVNFNNEKYNKCTIYKNEYFIICIISWKQGQKSGIHNHPQNGCIFKCLEGKLKEEIFKNDMNNITYISYDCISEGDIKYSYGDIYLHDITPIENSVTLNVYCNPDFKTTFWDLKS